MSDQLRSIAILDARNRYRTDPDDPAIRKEIDWVVESILAETFPMR